ncbi:MAG: hypothetical protein JXA10_08605, partial [Anaerolineae bacterium]|nr:hypothetical protein [Anaerolineae bacterium]
NRLNTVASGFIVLRRSALEAAGGMLHLLDEASEEVALARVITEAGYRVAAIPVPAYVVMAPTTVNDATAHIQRKLITLRATDPARFARLLFANPLSVGSLLGFITEREGRWWGRRTWWFFVWLRLAVAWELDRIRFGRAFVWPAYAQLFMLDTFVTPVLWARVLVQHTFTWRGRWYRITPGGKARRVE